MSVEHHLKDRHVLYTRTILLQRLSSGHKTAPYQCTGFQVYLDLAVLDSVPVPGLPGSRRAGVLITRLLRITCRDYGDEVQQVGGQTLSLLAGPSCHSVICVCVWGSVDRDYFDCVQGLGHMVCCRQKFRSLT